MVLGFLFYCDYFNVFYSFFILIIFLVCCLVSMLVKKGKVIPLQAQCGPEDG